MADPLLTALANAPYDDEAEAEVESSHLSVP
jgi:hypothetical protein